MIRIFFSQKNKARIYPAAFGTTDTGKTESLGIKGSITGHTYSYPNRILFTST
jgi:hypothetical protein